MKIVINNVNAEKYASKEVFDNYAEQAIKAQKTLLNGNGAGNDFLGWVNLPEEEATEMLAQIKSDVQRLYKRCKYFVVIGIGGSYLGARAVIEALQGDLDAYNKNKEYPYIIYAGHTLNEDYYAQLLHLLDDNDYGVAIISKSGTTTEPAVAFRIIKHHLERKYGKQEARERIIAITDARKGALHEISKQEGYSQYIIPDNVGGRYSVLTPVGLLPIAMAGYDIDKFIEGARSMRKHCIEEEDNIAMQYAILRNVFYNHNRHVEVLVNYDPALRYISEWWKQLYGESEGKEGKGILPHSLSCTTDLHSMGQYMQEGERIMMETVISVASAHEKVEIPSDEQDLDRINYLCKKSLTEINHCAEQGTIEAHEAGDVPVIRIEMPEISEYTLGELIYFFEFACGISGYMLEVNPFNQPRVEAYKKNMFRLLGKK